MQVQRRIRTRTPEWRVLYDRIQVAMELTSRLNVLPFSDLDSRNALLAELLGKPLPDKAIVQGITIGDRTMISPKVTLITEGHPIKPADRYDFITVAPIVIEADVWIGAAATILPGVRIGQGSVVGAGGVIATDVRPLTVVSGAGHIERKHLEHASDPKL